MYLAWCFTIAFLIVLLTEELTDDESDAIEFIDKPRLSRERRIDPLTAPSKEEFSSS